MPDADFRSTGVEGQDITLDHLMFGADPDVADLSAAASIGHA